MEATRPGRPRPTRPRLIDQQFPGVQSLLSLRLRCRPLTRRRLGCPRETAGQPVEDTVGIHHPQQGRAGNENRTVRTNNNTQHQAIGKTVNPVTTPGTPGRSDLRALPSRCWRAGAPAPAPRREDRSTAVPNELGSSSLVVSLYLELAAGQVCIYPCRAGGDRSLHFALGSARLAIKSRSPI